MIETNVKFSAKAAFPVEDSAIVARLTRGWPARLNREGIRPIMTFQMRKDARKNVGAAAWVNALDGCRLFKCTVVDISDSGAKIAFGATDRIPEAFVLALSRSGNPSYPCRVVWRRSDAIGVKFASD